MTCRECTEFLGDYFSGELAADARATFEAHLTRCPNCVTYLEQYRTTVLAGKAAFTADAAEDAIELPEELIRAILAARRT